MNQARDKTQPARGADVGDFAIEKPTRTRRSSEGVSSLLVLLWNHRQTSS